MKLGLLAAPLVCGKSLYDGPAVGIGKCFVQCKFFLNRKPYINYRAKISIFDQDFKFRFSTKISIFGQNFDFRSKFRFLSKTSIFDQNSDF